MTLRTAFEAAFARIGAANGLIYWDDVFADPEVVAALKEDYFAGHRQGMSDERARIAALVRALPWTGFPSRPLAEWVDRAAVLSTIGAEDD